MGPSTPGLYRVRFIRPEPGGEILIMSSVYRFRFSMSSDGTKRIQPKRQTLDEAYSPPGLTRISKLYRILQIFLFMFQPIT